MTDKVGQMTQMTVTNFEEKGKPGVFEKTLFTIII
jgi:hypothetical protein